MLEQKFRNNCQSAFYVYRRVYRGENGIWRKSSTFFDFWILGIIKRTLGGKKITTVFRSDFYMYRGPFWGKEALEENKVFSEFFFGFEPQKFRIFQNLLASLSKLHSICTTEPTICKNVVFLSFPVWGPKSLWLSAYYFLHWFQNCILRLLRKFLIHFLNHLSILNFCKIWEVNVGNFSLKSLALFFQNCVLRVQTNFFIENY